MEIRLIDRMISAGWNSGRGCNRWAKNLNGARQRIHNSRGKIVAAYESIVEYLATFS